MRLDRASATTTVAAIGETILEEAFGWMAAASIFRASSGRAFCAFGHAGRTLQRAQHGNRRAERGGKIAWTEEVFVGGGMATTGAVAVSAGLAVVPCPGRASVAPPGTIDVGAELGLPPLPTRDVVPGTPMSATGAPKSCG